MTQATQETHAFTAEINQLLHLIVHSLYSHKEIFLRELISNASDALDRLKFRSLTDKEILGDEGEMEIRIIPNEEEGTLVIEDTGDGMTREEIQENLGTIARSGSQEFLKKLTGDKKTDLNLIGQFGVGFYSAFLVADKVVVDSLSVDSDEAVRWESDAEGSYTIAPSERTWRGTRIELTLREDQKEFLNEWRIRELVRKYSDYVSHPIKLFTTREEKVEEDGEEKTVEKTGFETVNSASALWRRPKNDISDEQYTEFYKHLTHDWNDPLAWTHFKVEGFQMFTGMLFIPTQAPFDLYMQERSDGIRLFVKRVYIMDDCKELVPEYLRFVRGIIDSDDLPLNVSREMLQESRVVRAIKKQVTKKTLDLLEELAEERPEDYATFWNTFGKVLKEGTHLDPKNKERIAALLRFQTSHGEEPTSLDAYIERMPEDQEHIYYITGESRRALASSPHTEALRSRGYEVLYWTDPVDEWVAMSLEEYDGKKLVSATQGDIKLDETEEELEKKKEEFEPVCDRIGSILEGRVKEVRISDRLTESPCCLVAPEQGINANLERILKANNQKLPESQRIFEVNPSHPLIRKLKETEADEAFKNQVELLYGQALLTEGSPLPDPTDFCHRLTDLMLEE